MSTIGTTYNRLFAFFGLRENPFHVSPNPRFYFSTPVHDSALAELLFGIEAHQGFLLMTGEAGTGKTTLLNQLLHWLAQHKRSTAYVFHSHLDPTELLEFVLRDFGVRCDSTRRSDLLSALHAWLITRSAMGDSPVIIVDEAQALSLRTLDQLRLLLNLETSRGKLLQIVLAGQPQLEEKLRRPELHQLRQRVMFHSRLSFLTLEQTSRYILSHLQDAGAANGDSFPEETRMVVHACSQGVPRVINLLCEHALINAYASQQHTVSPECIRRIASEFDLDTPPTFGDREHPANFMRLMPLETSEEIRTPASYVLEVPQPAPAPVSPPVSLRDSTEAPDIAEEIAAPASYVLEVPQPAPAPVSPPVSLRDSTEAPDIAEETAAPAPYVLELPQPAPTPVSPPVSLRDSTEAPDIGEETAAPAPYVLELPQPALAPVSPPVSLRDSTEAPDIGEEIAAPASYVLELPQPAPAPVSPPVSLRDSTEAPDIAEETAAPASYVLELPQPTCALARDSTEAPDASDTKAEDLPLKVAARLSVAVEPPRNSLYRTAWRKHKPWIVQYFESIVYSFVRDCRAFVLSQSQPLRLADLPAPKLFFRKGALVPIARWLRQPMTFPSLRRERPSFRRISPKNL